MSKTKCAWTPTEKVHGGSEKEESTPGWGQAVTTNDFTETLAVKERRGIKC